MQFLFAQTKARGRERRGRSNLQTMHLVRAPMEGLHLFLVLFCVCARKKTVTWLQMATWGGLVRHQVAIWSHVTVFFLAHTQNKTKNKCKPSIGALTKCIVCKFDLPRLSLPSRFGLRKKKLHFPAQTQFNIHNAFATLSAPALVDSSDTRWPSGATSTFFSLRTRKTKPRTNASPPLEP